MLGFDETELRPDQHLAALPSASAFPILQAIDVVVLRKDVTADVKQWHKNLERGLPFSGDPRGHRGAGVLPT